MTLWKYKKKKQHILEIKHNSKTTTVSFLWLPFAFDLFIHHKYCRSILVKTACCDLNWHWKSLPEEERWESELFLPAAFWNRFQTMKVWKNLNIYKVIYIASVVAYSLLSFRDFVVVSWENLIRLSLQFTFDGFGAIVFGSPGLGLCQEVVSCIHLFHFASVHLSREPGEYSIASGTDDLLDSRLSWFDRCGQRFLWSHLAETQDIIR